MEGLFKKVNRFDAWAIESLITNMLSVTALLLEKPPNISWQGLKILINVSN